MITGLTLKMFVKHLTSEGFSMFPVVYWAKVSEPAEIFTRFGNLGPVSYWEK